MPEPLGAEGDFAAVLRAAIRSRGSPIRVVVEGNHAYLEDLNISLVSPAGRWYYLQGKTCHPLPATELGDRLGESPANCSWHLRKLAEYGFVEEAAGGTGRQRPWQMTHLGMTWGDEEDGPLGADLQLAGRALTEVSDVRAD